MKPRAATIAALLILAGTCIRLWHFFANRSLFIDEARLALNIGIRTPGELLQPLWLEQVAPVPFLLLVKGFVEIFGMHEMSLRLVSLLAGCALLPLMWRLASRLLQPPSALLALALVAFSPGMIRAANDAKPYSLDSCIAVGLLLLGLKVIDEAASERSIATAGCAAIIAVAFSFTGAMVASVVLLIAGVFAARQGNGRRIAIVGAGTVVTLAMLAIPYFTLYRVVGDSLYMREFWAESFLTGHLGHDVLLAVAFVWGWIGGNIDPLTRDTSIQSGLRISTILVLLVSLIGLWQLVRSKGWYVSTLLAGPIIIFVTLNALRAYPSVFRLELFAVPVVAILVSRGLVMSSDSLCKRVMLWFSAIPVGCVLGVMLASSLIPRLWPYFWQELSRVVLSVPESARLVYVNAGGAPGWAYYTTDWTKPDIPRLRWLLPSISAKGPAFENATTLAPPAAIETLRREGSKRVELVGSRTGVSIRPYDSVRSKPLHGWAEGEAERLLREGSPDAWLVFANNRWVENAFIGELEMRGAVVQSTVSAKGAAVLHVKFESNTTQSHRSERAKVRRDGQQSAHEAWDESCRHQRGRCCRQVGATTFRTEHEP